MTWYWALWLAPIAVMLVAPLIGRLRDRRRKPRRTRVVLPDSGRRPRRGRYG